jgi:hypothetical protein
MHPNPRPRVRVLVSRKALLLDRKTFENGMNPVLVKVMSMMEKKV